MVDHCAKAVDAGAGQSSADALLHDVETIIHHAGCQLTFLICVHCNSLIRRGDKKSSFIGKTLLAVNLNSFKMFIMPLSKKGNNNLQIFAICGWARFSGPCE